MQPVDVLVPPLGTNTDTVTLVAWHAREGDCVRKDEPLFSVETDKATLDVEAPASGILRDVTGREGMEVVALSRIAVIAESVESPVERKESALPFISPRAKQVAIERGLEWRVLSGTGPEGAIVERDVQEALARGESLPERMAGAERTGKRSTPSHPPITPLARRVAEESGVEWGRVTGSGTRGRIIRDDIEKAIDRDAGCVSDDDALEIVPLTGARAIVFERMARASSETAAVTLTTEVDATGLFDLRADANAGSSAVTYNDVLLMILARALRDHPRVNASLAGDAVKVWKRVNIGLAVDTERGLLVPVLRDVDRKRLAEIAAESAELVRKARSGSIRPEELNGGTFTLTNLGMYGIDLFTPIIRLPECAILGVGRIEPRPAVVEDRVVVRRRAWISLTFDHRLLDGGPAARFLQRVAQLVEKPHRLLL